MHMSDHLYKGVLSRHTHSYMHHDYHYLFSDLARNTRRIMSETNDLQAVIYEESSAHKMDFPLDFVNHMHIQRLAMLVICPQANIIRRI